MDNTLLPTLLQLCKGFRKHLLFEISQQFKPAIEKFKKAYNNVFEY